MKTIKVIIAASMISLSAIAGNYSKVNPEKYCTKMENGKMVVMHEGKKIMADVTLPNGTIIKMNGTVVKKGGTTTTLKQNQCVDQDGMVMDENPKMKSK